MTAEHAALIPEPNVPPHSDQQATAVRYPCLCGWRGEFHRSAEAALRDLLEHAPDALEGND